MVDEGRIAFRPAVEISYLLKDEQEELYEAMSFADATPSLAQAIKMKEFSKNGKLTPEVIASIMGEEKPNQREKFSFRADRLRKFIPASVPYSKTEEYVLKALEHYHRYQERIANCNSSIAREAPKPVGIVTYHLRYFLLISGSKKPRGAHIAIFSSTLAQYFVEKLFQASRHARNRFRFHSRWKKPDHLSIVV